MKLTRTIKVAAAALVAALVFQATAFAELRKLEQKVHGMDCAPCAYGLEKGLKKLPGVKKVKVSLNKGTATLELAPGNGVTVENIKQVVRDNGFTPKETKIIEGTEPSKGESSQPKK